MDLMFYDGLPSCAIACANRTVDLTPCGPNNITASCLCPEVEWQHAFGGCVMKECLPFDGLTARNVTLTHCGVPPRQTAEALGASAFLLALTVVVFCLRMLAKAIRLTPWGADDITIVIGFAAAIIFGVMKFIGRRFGFGLDFWTLRYDTIVEFMKIFYAFANVYTLAIAALKATILFFYQRVFGGFSSPFTTILWCTQAFNLLTFIGFTIPTIAQCQPLSFAWEGWDGRHEGFCLNILSMIVTHAAVNIGLDVWMLVLPSTQVLRLNLRWREKAEILAMFGIGIFITAVSIIRLTVLLNLRNFENPTQDAFYLHIYATAATPLDPKIISSHKARGTKEYGPSTARRFNEDAKEYTNYGS
ncbi:hypothetical protein CGCS363_v014721 [Colletotrichum siamense]|uniref:uncharacterized protein n=1 Tax=Colletotrichum siamense TaxID=690259 RepID=UPI001872407E|nr:uncharacterized protein CGCS363_v014721 [Colletotrichum siamense]KAF5485250.1 hypothetical protein CGCS363_v014721 [Colletotrichum siamense]